MIDTLVETLKILLLAVLAAVVYGILHDQVTVRVCLEYFTVAHPRVFDTDSPTLLAAGWGIIATWWMGFVLGIPAAVLAAWGRAPKLRAAELLRPIAVLLGTMACLALLAGVAAYVLTARGVWTLDPSWAIRISGPHHARFQAASAAHLTSYGVGAMGGVFLCLWIWWQRRLRAAEQRRSHGTTPARAAAASSTSVPGSGTGCTSASTIRRSSGK